ncbi:circularly permuted type 2 ATP-grasp protein [Bythopirellula polymerisocia]|uniref:Uncharacterized protein n=1 Tax=Bythopirellula polymerisocia TaxID=2528003 RepID=A0A5C6CP81_9BACT|nr:circularly permuted type 2 ATP-grasp protein [Bythopirellula polymerisocia]TWU24549.1 hypothetical protein Pla144_34330 [Bythopirellula polymerisocia]
MSRVEVSPFAGESLFAEYAPDDSFYDEIFRGRGEVRASWSDFLSTIASIGRTELMSRWLQAQEDIHETGIAYNIYDQSDGAVRPWELDLLPQLISPEEWSSLSVGLVQRAKLLNRLLADLYGPQESLRRGLLPAEWLFSHPGFRRVFHGQTPPKGTFLHFYAADLARAPDGRWWVVGDRTDAPLGLGYALENRIVTSRMLSNAIRSFNIERLAPFFKTLQGTLRAMAPAHRDNPRIVLLSQGPSGPNYFEDAYLARYLGYTLVEGGDLAVREDHVFLKTLAGLLPVDVILRRLSDEFCDPLELRGTAGLGVPGLLQAARQGHVVVANTLGSSLVESPSLMPFLPGIAREWLGEELALPSVATWWCGQESARTHVLSQFKPGVENQLSLRSAFRLGRRDAISEDRMRQRNTPEITKLLQTEPSRLIAQEAVQRSTTPVWCDSSPTQWHLAMRVFLVAKKHSYHVMPGGLIRLDRNSLPLDLSVLGGRLSKDAWVQATGPVQEVTLLATAKQPVVLRRSGAELPSRVADNLFWFGRRIERAQGTCRLLRPVVARLTGEGESEGSEELAYLIHCLAEQGHIEPGFAVEGMKDRLPTIANILPASVMDAEMLGSLRHSVAEAHRNASLVRDRLSLDSWRIVHHIERLLMRAAQLQESSEPSSKNGKASDSQKGILTPDEVGALIRQPFGLVELDELLGELVVNLSALDGLIGESMTRTSAWRFLELGKRLERSLHVVSLVQSFSSTSDKEEGRVLEAILEVADSIMTYRSRYLAAVSRAAALDLLLTDETNPRSLAYQLVSIADHVAHLPRNESKPLGFPEERIAISLLNNLRMLEVEDLSIGSGGKRTKLERFLQQVDEQLPKLSDLISHRYLIHAGVARQMSGRGGSVS